MCGLTYAIGSTYAEMPAAVSAVRTTTSIAACKKETETADVVFVHLCVEDRALSLLGLVVEADAP